MTSFSVVVCTLRRPGPLARCLEALAACRPPPDEVVVVDGDEARSARPVAAAFAGVRYVPAAPGLTRQRNRGLSACTADVVAFVDDDARVAPDVFARLAEAYADPAVAGATGRVVEPGDHRFGGRASWARRLVTGTERPGTFTASGYPRRHAPPDRDLDVELMPGCFMTARRHHAAEVGFDERLAGYGLAEDEDFSWRLSRLGRIRYLSGAVVDHDNAGYAGRDGRAFGRQVVVNRSYLFRKNFPQTGRARAHFALMVGVLVAHRVVNRDWPGARGLLEGLVAVATGGRPR